MPSLQTAFLMEPQLALTFVCFISKDIVQLFTLRSPKILNLWQGIFYIMSGNIEKGAVLLVDMK